jgi:hypothetical protein
MASTQGVLFPIIFFYINPSIRKKWQQLIAKQCCRFCLLEDDPDKLPRQSESNESNEIEETVEPGESTSNNTDSMFVLEDSFNVLFFQSSNSSNTIITNSSVEMPSFAASPSSIRPIGRSSLSQEVEMNTVVAREPEAGKKKAELQEKSGVESMDSIYYNTSRSYSGKQEPLLESKRFFC